MADRYDMDRDRDRDRERGGGRDWDRGRDWGRENGRDFGEHRYAGEPGREEWDRDRERRSGNEGRYGEARYEDYGRQHRGGGDEGWRDNRYSGSERVADYGNRGDWGRQGSWGAFGNRPDYNRGNDFRQSRGMGPGRVESDFGGANSSRTNLYGTGGGGFGTGFSSYGAGMGNFGAGNFGGGMSAYGERGRYSGRGPKGWQRSDERIREDVSERLADHPHIDASEVEVTVNNGEITLSGTVEDRHAKRLAEDIAESVSGVREVHNQIKVQQGQQVQHGERQMANAGPVEQRSTTSTTNRNK
jgi:hypothetical protein